MATPFLSNPAARPNAIPELQPEESARLRRRGEGAQEREPAGDLRRGAEQPQREVVRAFRVHLEKKRPDELRVPITR